MVCQGMLSRLGRATALARSSVGTVSSAVLHLKRRFSWFSGVGGCSCGEGAGLPGRSRSGATTGELPTGTLRSDGHAARSAVCRALSRSTGVGSVVAAMVGVSLGLSRLIFFSYSSMASSASVVRLSEFQLVSGLSASTSCLIIHVVVLVLFVVVVVLLLVDLFFVLFVVLLCVLLYVLL